jgi:hypothetical protein
MPTPKHTPCERNRCQICVANDAAIKLNVSKKTPVSSVTLVPKYRVLRVASGATNMAIEMERPPTKAYSKELTSRPKVLFAR